MAWISEKQQLPIKTSRKGCSYGENLHRGRFYDQRERDYITYVHIDVNLDGRGWVFCCSTFNSQKRNRGHLPFKLVVRIVGTPSRNLATPYWWPPAFSKKMFTFLLLPFWSIHRTTCLMSSTHKSGHVLPPQSPQNKTKTHPL